MASYVLWVYWNNSGIMVLFRFFLRKKQLVVRFLFILVRFSYISSEGMDVQSCLYMDYHAVGNYH